MKKNTSKMYAISNLLFVFIFLNVWDLAINKILFNGMALGAIMFLPVAFLWYVDRFRATVLVTLISIFEFMVMFVFVWEGFELSGVGYSTKSLFWVPFLLAAGINGFLGLNIYSKVKKKTQLV